MNKMTFLFLAPFAAVGCGGPEVVDAIDYVDYRCDWEATTFPADNSFQPKSIRVLGKDEVWVVGSRLTPGRFGGDRRVTTIYRRTGGVWKHLPCYADGETQSFARVVATDADNVWIAGDRVLNWDGMRLRLLKGYYAAQDVFTSSPEDTLIVQIVSRVDRVRADGAVDIISAGDFSIQGDGPNRSIWGISPTDYWGVRTGGIVRGDGANWESSPGGETGMLRVTSLGDSAVAVGTVLGQARLLDWKDGMWSSDAQVSALGVQYLDNLYIPAPGVVWVTGANGLVAGRSAGVWEQHVQTDVLSLAIDGTGENDVWIAGVHKDGHVVVRRWDGSQWIDEG